MNASRNLTISLPVELIRRAKVYAAHRDTSLNALVKQSLERVLDEENRYNKAVERLLAKSKDGLFEIEPGGWRRDELYE